MSHYGLEVAQDHGRTLPTFGTQSQAERALFKLRDDALADLLRVPEIAPELDYSPESLVVLEQWFFDRGEPDWLPSGVSVPAGIGFYLGQTYCRSADFLWVVQESPFTTGKYEIGVQKDLRTIMVTAGRKPIREGNARMQSLLREFRRYAI